MSVLGVVKFPAKQPYDICPYAIDLTPYVPAEDYVSGVAARVYVKDTGDPETAYEDMVYATDHDSLKIVQASVQSGTDGVTYRIRYRVSMSNGHRYEIEGEFKVVETE